MLHSIILIDPTASLTVKPDANTRVVEPMAGEKIIKVEQIRQLVSWLGQRGFEQGTKRAIVLQAQRWHYDAPHILLKSLEEPVANTDIILTTDSPSSMVATIRSRCATFSLDQMTDEQLAKWGMERSQSITFEPPQSWTEFIDQSVWQRWSTSDKLVKGKHSLAAIFAAWQAQILQQPSTAPVQRVYYVAALDQAIRYLQANVSPRLAFDYLLLKLES